MYQVIARKYRPQTFSELIGQEHVRSTLDNAITQRRIAHGYIFSGQRGTGKTTIARILARCLNCVEGPTATPCGVCSSCLEVTAGNAPDVIEIDAASNRGINEMRELRENVRYRPARDRYKIFIIDEAHQITNEAFNALLKTLEEPPEWAVFVLCTTESHKIPTTIASRCQQFSFRSVEFGQLVERMRWICGQEGITADDEALAVLAQSGEGSVRDSLSALDQAIACCGNDLQGPAVRDLLGLYSLESLSAVTRALEKSEPGAMLEVVAELEANGKNLQHFTRELARWFRNLLVARLTPGETRLIAASPAEQEKMRAAAAQFSEEDLTRWLQFTLDLYSQLQYSLQPRFHLELGLLRLIHAGRLKSIEEALKDLGPAAPAPQPPRPAPRPFEPAQSSPPASAPLAPKPPAPTPKPATSPPPASGPLKQRLHAALETLGASAFTLDAIDHSEIIQSPAGIEFIAPRHQILALRNKQIEEALAQVLGRAPRIKLTPGAGNGEAAEPPPPPKPADDEETLQRALAHPAVRRFQEVFPGARVMGVRNLKE
ncbi:MAG: DNA polymerase III subunit gamma/tau [Bryobacteraceae bacterium]|nr:DNA polymerase III subunit gamma/tau [Bryobacteraceae bacterium]